MCGEHHVIGSLSQATILTILTSPSHYEFRPHRVAYVTPRPLGCLQQGQGHFITTTLTLRLCEWPPPRHTANLGPSLLTVHLQRMATETNIPKALAAGILCPSSSPLFFCWDGQIPEALYWSQGRVLTFWFLLRTKRKISLTSRLVSSVVEITFCQGWKISFIHHQSLPWGFIVSVDRIQMDPAKVSSVASWPVPDFQKQFPHFFYCHFMVNYSCLAAPRTALTPTETPFQSSPAVDKAFHILRLRFTSVLILQMPGTELQLVFEVDSSDEGRELSFPNTPRWSTSSTPVPSSAEKNYNISNWEPLVVKIALEKWRQW